VVVASVVGGGGVVDTTVVVGAVVVGEVVATAVVVAAEAMIDGSTFAGFEGVHAVTSVIATAVAAENARLMTTSPPPASQ
jgi:hypothetical protein